MGGLFFYLFKQMKKILYCLLLCQFHLVTVFGQHQVALYVAPSGNDKSNGTISKPFATLEKARKEARKILAKEKDISITVYIQYLQRTTRACLWK